MDWTEPWTERASSGHVIQPHRGPAIALRASNFARVCSAARYSEFGLSRDLLTTAGNTPVPRH